MVVEQSIDLLHAERGELDALVAAISTAVPGAVDLIIIDTLNRVMPGGDENSSRDMGQMVACAKQLEDAFGCAVMYVHHKGKDEKAGARGHSSLKAACDTEISVAKHGEFHLLHAEKVREGPSEVDIGAFKLTWVALPNDDDGEAGSCVIEPTEVPDQKKEKLPPQARLAFRYLHRALDNHAQMPPPEVREGAGRRGPIEGQSICPVDVWQQVCQDSGGLADSDNPDTHRKAFVRARRKLETLGNIGVYRDWVWLADKRT